MKLRLLGTAIVLILATSSFARAEVLNCADGDVICLANAINTANANGEDDTILLEEDGIYTLTAPDPLGGSDGPTGLPSITSVITLNGNGATIQRNTADDTPPFRILHVGEGGKLTLDNTAIKNGISHSGGGIYSSSDLTVSNCIISNNAAEPTLIGNSGRGGGINSWGHLVMSRCLVEDNRAIGGTGGGVSGHIVTITGSTFARNQVVYVHPAWEAGGAIFGDYVEIMDSVLIHNRGTFPYTAGAVYAYDEYKITNSTIAFGGGIEANDDYGESSITNVTMVFNDGKTVGSYGGCDVKNSIIYGGDTLDCPDCGSEGNNILDGRCDIELQSSDITDDPRLGSFQYSDVPGMAHFPLLHDSPAIDTGDNGDCTLSDQLGNPRVDGDDNGSVFCDIGAVEYQAELLLTVGIDIKPGNKQNVINPRAKGGIWVAVLSVTDSESPVDPSSQVDIPTVEFGPDGAKTTRHKVKDINKDGLGDLLLRFKIPETGIACGDTEATLTGETFDGQSFSGTDAIKTVGCKPKKCHKKKHHKKHHHEHHDNKYHKMHHKKHHDEDRDDDHRKR